MSGISYTSALLIGTYLECVMYGVFVSLFIAACYVQWERFSRGQGINRLMAVATVLFGFTVTINLVISLVVTIQAILSNAPGATLYMSLDMQYSTKGITRFMILQLQATIADIIIIYRMYHIYDRNPSVCIIPSITTAAAFIAGCGIADIFRDPTAPSFQKALGDWTASSFSLSIFLFLTVAISFKLWRVHRQTTRACVHVEGSVILRAIKALIESAALWTAFAVMNFFISLTRSNLVYTFLAMTSPVVGISFCLIIVRLGRILPEARDETWHMPTHTQVSRMSTTSRVNVLFPQVNIQRDVHVSESEDFFMGTLGSQKEGNVNSPSKTSRTSLSLPAPV